MPLSLSVPSTVGVSPIFRHSSADCKFAKLTELGLTGCSQTLVRGVKPGRTSLSLPFDMII